MRRLYDRISGRGAVRDDQMRRARNVLLALTLAGLLWLIAFRHLLTGHSPLLAFQLASDVGFANDVGGDPWCKDTVMVVHNASDCRHVVEVMLRYSALVQHAQPGPAFLFVRRSERAVTDALRRLTANCTVPLPHDYVPLQAAAQQAVAERNDTAHCSSQRCAACMRVWVPDARVPPLYTYAASPDAFAVAPRAAMRRAPVFWRAWMDALSNDGDDALCSSCRTADRLWRYAFSDYFV